MQSINREIIRFTSKCLPRILMNREIRFFFNAKTQQMVKMSGSDKIESIGIFQPIKSVPLLNLIQRKMCVRIFRNLIQQEKKNGLFKLNRQV